MRSIFGGVAALVLAAGSVSVGFAQTSGAMGSMKMGGMMPHCTAAAGPVVWYLAASKKYYLKGSAQYGKGNGAYACRATAVARGGKPGSYALGGKMQGSSGAMGGGAMSHPSSPMTMAPRPGSTPSSGTSGMGNAAPGSQSSPAPASSMNPMGNASGNQGNTGAPGAGGQVPNNPASTSNSSPSPSPHP